MQRLITAAGALALLAGAPATAQTFFPSLAAYRYCELRQIGVDQRTSIDVAMRESASSSPIVYARGYHGRMVDSNVLLFTQHVKRMCLQEFISEPIPTNR